jgi:hypothetical protein
MLVIVRGIVFFDNWLSRVNFTAAVLATPLLSKGVRGFGSLAKEHEYFAYFGGPK